MEPTTWFENERPHLRQEKKNRSAKVLNRRTLKSTIKHLVFMLSLTLQNNVHQCTKLTNPNPHHGWNWWRPDRHQGRWLPLTSIQHGYSFFCTGLPAETIGWKEHGILSSTCESPLLFGILLGGCTYFLSFFTFCFPTSPRGLSFPSGWAQFFHGVMSYRLLVCGKKRGVLSVIRWENNR